MQPILNTLRRWSEFVGHLSNIHWLLGILTFLSSSITLMFSAALEDWSTTSVLLASLAAGILAVILLVVCVAAWRFIASFSPANKRNVKLPASSAGLIPNWTIRDLFFHIDPNILELKRKHYLERDGWEKIGDCILDKLSTGQLKAWGRLWARLSGHPPLTEIPASFWGTAALTYDFFDASHQNLKHARPRDGRDGTSYADIQVNREQVLTLWPIETDKHIPLGEAARRAYEETLHSLFAKTAERFDGTPDGTIKYYSHHLLLHVRVFGCRPPSTKREEFSELIKKSFDLTVQQGVVTAKERHGKGLYTNLTVVESELPSVVGFIQSIHDHAAKGENA
jgi:hypothetical protein